MLTCTSSWSTCWYERRSEKERTYRDNVSCSNGLALEESGERLEQWRSERKYPERRDKREHTINDVRVQLLLDDGLALEDLLLGRGSGLDDVLLDVVHDVVIDRAVEDGLHLDHAVIADRLLDDWRPARWS